MRLPDRAELQACRRRPHRPGEPGAAVPASAPAVVGLPPAITAWLARVRAADTPEAGGEADDYPEGVRDRLIYVIDVEPSGRPTITPMKATLRKDGTIGKTARRYDASRLYWTETPKFVRRVDEPILRRIDFLRLNQAPLYGPPAAARRSRARSSIFLR